LILLDDVNDYSNCCVLSFDARCNVDRQRIA